MSLIFNTGFTSCGGGETKEVQLTDMQASYPIHPVSRGDKFYDTDDKYIVTSLIDNPVGYQSEFCTRETPKYGVFYIYDNVAYVWNGEDLVRYTASNNYVALENKPMINGTTLLGDEDGEHYGLVDKDTFLNKLYPTGTILFTYTKVSPATYIGGQWELIEEGYYPVATEKATIDEETERLVEPILPKFTGSMSITGNGSSKAWLGASGIVKVTSTGSYYGFDPTSGKSSGLASGFTVDSSNEENSIYKGEKNEVKPKSILLYMWRRIDSGQLTYNFVNLSFSATDFAVDQQTGQVSLRNGIYYYTPNEIPKADQNGKLVSSGININNIVLNTRKVAGCALSDDITDIEIQNAIKDCVATLTNKSIDADNNFISNLETENMKSSAIVSSSDNVRDYDTSVDTKLTTEKFVQKVLKNIPTPTGNNDAVNKAYVDAKIPSDNLGAIKLLSVTTAPQIPVEPLAKYYNSSKNKIITANNYGLWDETTAETPTINTLYICDNLLYIYTGTILIRYTDTEILIGSGTALPSLDNCVFGDKYLNTNNRKLYTVENFIYELQNYTVEEDYLTPPTLNTDGSITGFRAYASGVPAKALFNTNNIYRNPQEWKGSFTFRIHISNLFTSGNVAKIICFFGNSSGSGANNYFNWGLITADYGKLYWVKFPQSTNFQPTTAYMEKTLLVDYTMNNTSEYYIEIKKNSDGTVDTTISTKGYGIDVVASGTGVSCPDYATSGSLVASVFSYGGYTYDTMANNEDLKIYLADSSFSKEFLKKADPIKYQLQNYRQFKDLPDFAEENGSITGFMATSAGVDCKYLSSEFNSFPEVFKKLWTGAFELKFHLKNVPTTGNAEYSMCLFYSRDNSQAYAWGFSVRSKKLYWVKYELQNGTTDTFTVSGFAEPVLLVNYELSDTNKDYYIIINKNSNGTVNTKIIENGYEGTILAQDTVSCPDYVSSEEIVKYCFSYSINTIYSYTFANGIIFLADSFGGDVFLATSPGGTNKNWGEKLVENDKAYFDTTNKYLYVCKNNTLTNFTYIKDVQANGVSVVSNNVANVQLSNLITDENEESDTLVDTSQFSKVDTTNKKNLVYKMLQVWDYIIGKLQPTMDNIINAVNNLTTEVNKKASKDWTYAGLLNGQGATITIPSANSNWKEMCVIMRVLEGAYYYQYCQYVLRETFSEGSPDGVYVLFNYGSTGSDGTGTFYSARVRLKYNASTRVLTNNYTTVQAWQFVNAKIYVR